MKNLDSPPAGFFKPLFEELSFNISPLALHPHFTLKMFSKSPVLDKQEDLVPSSDRYGWELFEKLTEIETYDYHSLMTYHLENIVNKRKWIECFIMLIVSNKELFISQCGIEKYTFLFEMVVDHYSVFKNTVMSPLSTSCEECGNRIITNIKHDAEFIDHFDGPVRDYFCFKLNKDYNRFGMIRNFNIDPLALENFKYSNKMTDINNRFEERENEAYVKKGLKDLSGLKPIVANCTTGDCAKYVADFLNNCTDEDGDYVFDYKTSNLSEWMPLLFDCKKSKKITASSYRDKFPSKSTNRQNNPQRGQKR